MDNDRFVRPLRLFSRCDDFVQERGVHVSYWNSVASDSSIYLSFVAENSGDTLAVDPAIHEFEYVLFDTE